MKLHLPIPLRKALLTAMITVPMTIYGRADANNILINHGEVDSGVGINGKLSDQAYGWAGGLDFTADGDTACNLGVITDFSDFDSASLEAPTMPTMPVKPPSVPVPDPAAEASYVLAMGQYALAWAQYLIDVDNLADTVLELMNVTDAVNDGRDYSSNFIQTVDVEYDSSKIYNSIISQAYNGGAAGSTNEKDDFVIVTVEGIPTNMFYSAVSHGNQDTSATGYINVEGANIMFSNKCEADSYLNITDGGSLLSPNATGSVDITGEINVEYNSTLSAKDVYSNQEISVNGDSTLAATNLSSAGDITIEDSTLASIKNDLNVNSSITINDSSVEVNRDFNSNSDLAVNNSDITAGRDINLSEFNGSGNTVRAGDIITIDDGIVGNNNTYDTDNGKINVGSTGSSSITGSNNKLGMGATKTEDIALDGSIDGNGNQLKATQTITTGGINGNDNDLTVTDSRNNPNSEVLTVNGSIKGDKNDLYVVNNGSIRVDGDISNTGGGTVGNSVIVGGNGNITVTGKVEGTNETIKTLGTGNVELGSLGNNSGLEVLVKDGTFHTNNASNSTLSNNSTIKVSGDITLGDDLASPDKSSTLTLTTGSSLTSTDGDITANQNLKATGSGTSISAENGDLTVNATLTADDKAAVKAETITADHLTATNGATVTATDRTITLNDGNLIVTDAKVDGDVTGVKDAQLTGNTGKEAFVDGSIAGNGTGSTFVAKGNVTTGSDTNDGSVTDFESITLGDTTDAMVSDITIKGDVSTTTNGTINVINGDSVEITGSMTSGTTTNISNSDLTVDEDQSAGTSISIDDSIVDIGHDQSAGTSIGITDSEVYVGNDQTAGTSISVDGSYLEVGHDQKAGTSIDITDSQVYVDNDQSALTSITVEDSYMEVGNDQTAEQAITIDGSEVYVGHDQSAGTTISIDDSLVDVDNDQTAGESISITSGSIVTVGNDQKAGSSISIDDSIVDVGHDQSADTSISITNGSEVTVGNDQTAGTTISIDGSLVEVVNDQTAGSSISITNGSDLTVGNDQTAGTSITVNDSTVDIGNDQTAQDGSIDISNSSNVTVGDNMTAIKGATATEGSINITDSTVSVGDPAVTGDDHGNMTADTDINIGTSTVNVTGNQTAKDGDISISNSNSTDSANVSGSDYAVVIGGDQSAGGGISIDDSTVNVGDDQIAGGSIDIENGSTVVVADNMRAEGGDITIDASEVSVGTVGAAADGDASNNDMFALNNIDINNAVVNIVHDQIAQNGKISIKDSNPVYSYDGQLYDRSVDGVYSVVVGNDQVAGTDIEVENSSVKVVNDQTAGESIVIDSSVVDVGNDQTAEKSITITDSLVDVGNDQSAGESISIDNSEVYIGNDQSAGTSITITNDSEVYVDHDQTAGTTITIEDSYLEVGNDQSAEESITIDNSEVYVGNDQTAGTTISIDDSLVEIVNDQTAGESISITNDTDLTVGNDQTAGTSITIDDSTVDIGHDQNALDGSIDISNSSTVTVGDNMTASKGATATEASINITDSTVTVGDPDVTGDEHGNMIADTNIDMSNSTVTVSGDQIANDGSISSDKSIVDIGEDQNAGTSISITNESEVTVGNDQAAGTTISIDDSLVEVGNDQTAGESISVTNSSDLTVGNDQTAGTSISIDGSTVDVGHDQSALDGSIDISNSSTVTVGDNMTASKGATATEGSINITDSTVTVGDPDVTGDEHGNMTADTNIDMSNSTVTVSGDQVAEEGYIEIVNSTVDVGEDQNAGISIDINSGSTVTVGNDQTAGTTIDIDDSKVTVGNDQIAGEAITITNGSEVDITNDQIAGTDITIADATVTVGGDQTAEDGSIDIDDSIVSIGGDQTAQDSILIDGSTVDIGGDQTATDGTIEINDSTVTIGGEQIAGEIIIDGNSDVEVSGGQEATDGAIIIHDASVLVDGDQTAGTYIDIQRASVDVAGSQSSNDGTISIADSSTVTVGDSMTASKGQNASSANIVIDYSMVTVGSSTLTGDDNNNMTADMSIAINKGTVSVLNDMTANAGVIFITNSNIAESYRGNVAGTNYAVVVGDSMTAQADPADVDNTGHIVINSSSVLVGTEGATDQANSMTADGVIMIDDSEVTVIGDQTAGGSISVGDSDLVVGGDQTAGDSISIIDSTVLVEGDMEAETAYNGSEGNSIQISGSDVDVDGSMTAADGGRILITGGSTVDIDDQLVADNGSLVINGNGSVLNVNIDDTPLYASSIGSDIAKIQVDAINQLNTGAVVLNDVDLDITGRVAASSWETVKGTNTISGSAGEGSMRADDYIKLGGTNEVVSNASVYADIGDITISGDNTITDSNVYSEDGAISVISDSSLLSGGTATTTIVNSTIDAGTTVSIAGLSDSLAVVRDSNIWSYGTAGLVLSTGSDIEMGILFDNADLSDMDGSSKSIAAREGSIVLRNRVDMTNTTLFTNTSGTEGETIMLDGSATLNMHANSILEGTLSSADTSASIVKDGSDVLALNYSARAYNGLIDVTANDGSELTINTDGVGQEAVLRLKDTNLIVTDTAFANAADGVVTVGTIDTSLDAGNRYTAAGDLNRILANGSYTNDDNNRDSFKNIGTVISINEGNVGDTIAANGLKMNEYTLVRLEGSLNADGSVSSDNISVSGTLDAGGARVFGTLLSGLENEALVADQTRVQIVKFGENADVKSTFNQDMLYDVAFDPATGTYQRTMRTLNAWVETTADGVYLTYSKNYLGATKNDNQQQAANTLEEIANGLNHTEGTLGSSSSMMDQLINALGYTRSELEAKAALDSLSGVSNSIAQHAMMDGNRHHMETLRQYISLPSCNKESRPGMSIFLTKDSSAWVAYTGGYDFINGDQYMGDYTRTYQGAIMGYELSLNCNYLVGIDFGYENAIARTTGAKFKSNNYYVDLYGSAKTGIVNHRMSIGVGIYDFDAQRDVVVLAGSNSFFGRASGDTTGTALNVGYEVSSDLQVGKRSFVTPYVTANFSYNHISDLEESGGIGNAGVLTRYDNVAQFDMGAGARFTQEFSLLKNQAPATFFASVAARVEFSSHQPKSTNSFTCNSDLRYDLKSVKRAPFFMQVGAGVIVPFAKKWSAAASANGEFGNDRAGVNGSVGVRYDF